MEDFVRLLSTDEGDVYHITLIPRSVIEERKKNINNKFKEYNEKISKSSRN